MDIQTDKWIAVREFIKVRKRLLLTTHLNPDGDALGSELAMAYYLRQIDKEPVIINSSQTPRQYHFLDPHNEIRYFNSKRDWEIIQNCDGGIILDLSDWRRLDKVGETIRKLNLATICIDHHLNSEKMGELQVIDENASSTGELIYDFLIFANATLSLDLAEALYTCILTDTGSFRFTNTTPKAHRVVADLIARGVDFRTLYKYVYESNSPGQVSIKGQVMSNLHYNCNGKLVWFTITRKMMEEARVHRSDLEGFAEIPREIAGVEVSIMFTEIDDQKVKISLRSIGNIPINGLAGRFNGGGHKYAAGAVFEEPIDYVIARVIPEAIKLISGSHGSEKKK